MDYIMSLVLQSSSGGQITIQEPATASNFTQTLPAATGTVALLQIPSFATTIGVGGATPSTSGAGITFPATKSPSTDANTLDDYEEGTWTPVDSSGAGLNFTQAGTARYTKIGRIVFVNLYVIYPATGSTANASIGGLPFTAAGSETYAYLVGRAGSLAVSIGQVSTSGTSIGLFKNSNTAIANNELSGTFVIISGTYTTA
jgi:hypothetical protein